MSDDKPVLAEWYEVTDESGDIIIDIPPEVLETMKVQAGDKVVDGVVTLKPKRIKPIVFKA